MEGGISAASFFHSSFLHAINAVMLWPVLVQKVLQAWEHLPCPAKLQTRCDICFACQSICPFIPTDSGVPRTVDPQKSLQPKSVHGCVPVRAANSRLHLLQQVPGVCENHGICVICASHWEASHCIVCVTASTSMVRMEVESLGAPLSSCTVLAPCLTVNPQPD